MDDWNQWKGKCGVRWQMDENRIIFGERDSVALLAGISFHHQNTTFKINNYQSPTWNCNHTKDKQQIKVAID